ncbi:MAG TPA: NlpC/P60 family protein [Nitrospira sp.]|nr:NlpC/P60 family protein [Nitrospira sp.]
MRRKVFIGGFIVAITLVGCSSMQRDRIGSAPAASQDCCRSSDVAPSRSAIVRSAAKLVGARTVEMNGRRIHYDCAGVTRAVFLEHGIDLYESRTADRHANGVRLIYNHIREYGRLHQGPAVRPGDLVFFDNTWDSNGDGKMNDPLTHVGIVERQDRDGTITFISRVAGAVERYRMNLGLPHVHRGADGNILNDHLRRKDTGTADQTGYLTGELFAGFGTRTGL